MRRITAEDIIDRLGLSPLAGEGGYFRQTWIREGDRPESPVGTCIFYLVTPDSFSALHRLWDDEIFHFYLGDPCEAVMVDPAGGLTEVTLGSDIMAGMHVQHIVPAGYWQGTRLAAGGSWALLGTTMAPGFRQDGFELANPDDIGALSPEVAARVRDFLAPHP